MAASESKRKQAPVWTIETLTVNIENTLKQKDKWDAVLTKLGGCRTDFERLGVVLGTEEVLEQIAPCIVKRGKSVERAERLRSRGNESFKLAHYDKALSFYTQAVLQAPVSSQDHSGSSLLALCFGNRSAAFFHLKQFRSCLVDIANAVEAGFPAASLHKLLDRKGKCCLFLKRKQAAVQAFQEAKQALLSDDADSVQDKTKQDLIRLTDQFILKCQSMPDGGQPEGGGGANDFMIHEPTPMLSETSPLLPCAAGFLAVRDEEGRGRGLYALRDIKIGEVLIVESPYTSVVLTDHCLTHCHHCCSRCVVPLPCLGCADVVFCSPACRRAAHEQDRHAAECQLMGVFHTADVRLAHLAYKMVAKAGYEQLMQNRQALEHPDPNGASDCLGCDEKGVYDSGNYATMYHLVGHGEKRAVLDIWPRAVKAAFMVKCLEQSGFFPPSSPKKEDADGDKAQAAASEEGKADGEDLCYVGSHILRHLMMLPCNAHEVSEMGVNWEEPSQSQTLEVGSAIYPVLSLINHSCDPSVVRHSYDNVCVVRAIRGVAKGEELFDNYGALYPVLDKPSRLTHLQKQYYFTCQCQACEKNWPMYMEIPKESMDFYCQKCGGRVPVPDIQQASKTDSMACRDCAHRQNIRSVILKVGSLERGFQDALHAVIFRLDVEGDRLQRLVQFLRVVDTHVHRPVSCHNDCQEAVKMCLAYKANAFPRKKQSC